MKKSNYVETAKSIIISLLKNGGDPTAAGLSAIFDVKGSDKELLKHIKALNNIFSKAIEELENTLNESDI